MGRFSRLSMNRTALRRMTWVIAAAVSILVLMWIVPSWLDQSRWRQWCEQHASAAIGRSVHIEKITFHLLPRPGFDAEHILVANPAWAKEPWLAQINRLSVHVRIIPLLHRKMALSAIEMVGVQLDREQNDAHQNNWQLLSSADHSRSPAPDYWDEITSVDVHQTTVHYASTQQDYGRWQIEHLHLDAAPHGRNLEASATVVHQQKTLSLHGSLDALVAPLQARLAIETDAGSITVDARRPATAATAAATSAGRRPFTIQAEAHQLERLLAFFQIESLPIAPLRLAADVDPDAYFGKGLFEFTRLAATLGDLQVSGRARVDMNGPEPILAAQLAVPRLDWVHTMAAAGRPPVPPPAPGELFRSHRLPWRLLAAVHGVHATVDLHVGTLKTRSGIELTDANAHLRIEHGQLWATALHAKLLDGSADGTLYLSGADKSAQLHLQLQNVSLQKGLQAMGKSTPLTGGPLLVKANINARGESMKALAASLTGPVTLALGATRIESTKGAQNEELLTGLLPFFSARDAHEIRLECATARLPFQNGRASAKPLVGARSQASALLTQGDIDLRTQRIDLYGRLRSRAGLSLGLAALSGDIRISGPLVHPQAKLDAASSPAAVARIGAAILTGGLSLVGTALWDTAHPGADPCAAVLANPASLYRSQRPTGIKAVR